MRDRNGKILFGVFFLAGMFFAFCLLQGGCVDREATNDAVIEKSDELPGAEQTSIDPRDLTFPELVFKVPEPERYEMANGIVVYLYEERLLPAISVYAVVRTGQIYEPAEKAGLASLTGAVMRTGGTRKLSGREVDEKLEFISARCTVNVSRDMGSARLTVLSKDFDEAMELFADILMEPGFEEAKIELRKQRLHEQFRRENDNPDTILGRELRRLTYNDHPYSRRLDGYSETIRKITREDLDDFHSRYFRPNNIILGVSGDFSRDEMKSKLEKLFGGWEKKETEYPDVPKVAVNRKRTLGFISKELNQSSFFIGNTAVTYLDPDYFPLMLGSYILGESGFNSRLVDLVRTKAGLAYNVGSFLYLSKDPGMFICYCSTKTESTRDAVQKVLDELERIRMDEVTELELSRAKEGIRNRFVFKFDQSSEIVRRYVNLEYHGLPRDYLKTYLQKIEAVTASDIREAARKHIRPAESTILVIGDERALKTFPGDFGVFSRIPLEKKEPEPRAK